MDDGANKAAAVALGKRADALSRPVDLKANTFEDKLTENVRKHRTKCTWIHDRNFTWKIRERFGYTCHL